MQVHVVGMSWYRPETFQRLISLFEDGHKLHRTYEDWLAAAEAGRNRLEAQGIKVFMVDIDPDEFPKWCAKNGQNLDAKGRNAFCNHVAYRLATGGGHVGHS